MSEFRGTADPKPLRILHVVDNFGKGGLENGLVNLIERLDPGRFEHTVCAIRRLGFSAERLAKGPAKVMCLASDGPLARLQVAGLARKIREIKPDIVHSRNWGAIEAVAAARLTHSCSVVHSEHGIDWETASREPLRRTWFRRLAFHLADRVLCVSNQLRELHARRTGFPLNKMSVIHNGVDTRQYHPDPAARARMRQELGLSDGDFCIGAVGNLFPVKDHLTLLQAVAEMAKSRRNWRLVLIGEGPELPRLKSFAASHPEWEQRVSFLGLSNRVPELLNALDVYVLPSVTEGICNSLLEAMATGLPVAVTDTGGNPEVVVDGQSGLLFPVGGVGRLTEHLLLLQERIDLGTQLRQAALRRVLEEFSMDSMVRNYGLMYSGLRRTPRTQDQRLLESTLAGKGKLNEFDG